MENNNDNDNDDNSKNNDDDDNDNDNDNKNNPQKAVIINNCRIVAPYDFSTNEHVKKEWKEKTIEDIFTQYLHYIPKNGLKSYLEKGNILLNNKKCLAHTKLNENDIINVNIHHHEMPAFYKKKNLKVIYNDSNYLIINKPCSIPVHSHNLYGKNSIIHMLNSSYYRFYNKKDSEKIKPNLKKFYNSKRRKKKYTNPYEKDENEKFLPVHRLDRLTSGVLMFAKNSHTAKSLSHDFQKKLMKKMYVALVKGKFISNENGKPIVVDKSIGKPKDGGVKVQIIENPKSKNANNDDNEAKEYEHLIIQDAKTTFELYWYDKQNDVSCVVCKPVTGRTAQIRIHLFSVGFPILNDPIYNPHYSSSNDKQNKLDSLIHDYKQCFIRFSNLFKTNDQCYICQNIQDWLHHVPPLYYHDGIFLHCWKYYCATEKKLFQTPLPSWAVPPSTPNVTVFSPNLL